jgi:hypothetical protein
MSFELRHQKYNTVNKGRSASKHVFAQPVFKKSLTFTHYL